MSFLRASSSLASIASSSASSLSLSATRSVAAIHTSAVRFAETQKQRTARLSRKANLERKTERKRINAETRPHVVLGTRAAEEDTKWTNCDLAKVLVSEENLQALPPTPPIGVSTKAIPPMYTNFGLDGLDGVETREDQIDLFLKDLPDTAAIAEADTQLADRFALQRGDLSKLSIEDKKAIVELQKKEVQKAQQLARIIDLRNANARGIAFKNRRSIIAAFSPSKNALDSGYPEVQVALITMKIRSVWSHMMQNKKDVHARRPLRMLVHKRAKMLKYIKRLDKDRYETILRRVALEPDSVEGELVV